MVDVLAAAAALVLYGVTLVLVVGLGRAAARRRRTPPPPDDLPGADLEVLARRVLGDQWRDPS